MAARWLSLTLAGLLLTAAGCEKNDTQARASDGTVRWTYNGQTYTSTIYSGAIVDSDGELVVTAGSADQKSMVSLSLPGISARGAGAYELRKGSVLDDLPAAALTLTEAGSEGAAYSSLHGPAASNGTITVTQYEKKAQKLAGTFSFTAGAVANTSASGTQRVTNGSFSFTRFR